MRPVAGVAQPAGEAALIDQVEVEAHPAAGSSQATAFLGGPTRPDNPSSRQHTPHSRVTSRGVTVWEVEHLT